MNNTRNSPVNQPYWTSVTSPSNSDGNRYQSPSVSPGYWNVASPAKNQVSPQPYSYVTSPNNSASPERRSPAPSTPPSQYQAPALPTKLGNKNEKAATKKSITAMNRNFYDKSSFDKEREKVANRRVQSLMLEVQRKNHREYSSGNKSFSTSSRRQIDEPMISEDVKGSVNDFKCGHDLDREYAAKKHALRIITRLNNAA